MLHILKCQKCGRYTLSEKCECGGIAVSPKPPKYSPEDPYAAYRRKAKEEERLERGLVSVRLPD